MNGIDDEQCTEHCITALIIYEPSGECITHERANMALVRAVELVHL